jgi:hypothetical protein
VSALVATLVVSGAGAVGTGVGVSGNEVLTALVPQSPYSPGPFDSGQAVDVVIPANSILTPGASIYLLECSAPNGVPPVSTTSCDGNTSYPGGTIKVGAGGAVDLKTDTPSHDLYPIYALPDAVTLEENSSNGATCGVGASNECVIYIGEGGGGDVGLSQPHFFSQPFQVRPDPTDSGTIDPGDGTAAVAASVSPSLSTVTPGTQTVTADGSDPATITVTLNDTNSAPVQGKTVTLTGSSGSSQVVPASSGSNVTNSNGQAIFTVTDSSQETVSYSAVDSTDGVSITPTASVTFGPETVNQAVSTVVADPTTVADDGTTASTITVTLRDHSVNGSPAPMTGRTISLAPSGGNSVIAPSSSGSNVTNASGEATFSVTNHTNQSVTYTATDTADSVVLTSTASVLFGPPLAVSPSASTVVANPSPALTTTGTEVTVTLLAGDGATPEPNKSVSLAVQSASGNAAVSTTNPVLTNSSGVATFTVTDSTAESVTITATDTTDSIVLTQQPVVPFVVPSAPTFSPSESTVVVTDSPQAADGLSEAIATVTALNTVGSPMAGLTVTLAGTPSATVSIQPVQGGSSAAPGTTNSQGQVQFGVRDTTAETVTLTATVNGQAVTQTAAATFLAGVPNGDTSTVAASPDQVAADGSTASTITVTLTDYFKNPVAGKAISLTPAKGTSVVTPVQVTTGVLPGTTNDGGVAQFTVTDATTEVVTYSATDTTDSLPIAQLVTVTFGTPPPVLPTMSDSTVVSSATSVVADGKTAATVTVELRDGNGDPVTGKTVTLTSSSSTAAITAAPAATSAIVKAGIRSLEDPHATTTPVSVQSDSDGNAVFDVTDTTPESVTLTAADTTDSLSGWTVAISFTAAPAGTATSSGSTTTTTTTAPASTSASAGSSGGATGSSSTGTGSTDPSDDSASTDASTSSTPALAFTGIPSMLPWLIGLGLALVLLGTFGRRLLFFRRKIQ